MPFFGWQYAITSHHIICFSTFGSQSTIEVFPLPRVAVQPNNDATIPSLTRSHKSLHNHRIVCLILLTERHEPHNNNGHPSAHYTFVATSRPRALDKLGFLDISLAPDSVTTTWTESKAQSSCESITGSSRAGVSRLLGWAPFNGEPIAITVSKDGNRKRVVRSRSLVMDDKRQQVKRQQVFDGIHGRMSFLVSRAQITVDSFV
jgi:hypothetical protein